MLISTKSYNRDVKGISETDKLRIKDYLRGAVYSWCNNNKKNWFSARDFLGGDNYFWQGTPLLVLYEKHQKLGKVWDKCVKDAGKDAGWLLKKVIDEDKRSFETKTEERIRKYSWNGVKDKI